MTPDCISADVCDSDSIITIESWGYGPNGANAHLSVDVSYYNPVSTRCQGRRGAGGRQRAQERQRVQQRPAAAQRSGREEPLMRVDSCIVVASLPRRGAGAGTARADRYARGQLAYQSLCGRCHTIAWKTPGPPRKIPRRSHARRRSKEGRGAARVDVGSGARLEEQRLPPPGAHDDQIGDLINFLHVRSEAAPPKLRVPSADAKHPQAPRAAHWDTRRTTVATTARSAPERPEIGAQ